MKATKRKVSIETENRYCLFLINLLDNKFKNMEAGKKGWMQNEREGEVERECISCTS